jgi:F-type H+-transporting ATPase subunit b
LISRRQAASTPTRPGENSFPLSVELSMARRRRVKIWQLLGGSRLSWWFHAKAALTASVLFVAHAAHAAGGGGEGGHHEPHVANWFSVAPEVNAEAPALGWMMFSFAVFLFVIYRAAGRPFANFLESRHTTVKNAIEEAKKAKDEAEKKQREYEEKLARLDDEIAKLKSEFETRGRAEIERLEVAGKAASARILKDAEATISAELKQAEVTLKTEASRLALELAEEKIKAVLSDADDARMRKDFFQGLSQSPPN